MLTSIWYSSLIISILIHLSFFGHSNIFEFKNLVSLKKNVFINKKKINKKNKTNFYLKNPILLIKKKTKFKKKFFKKSLLNVNKIVKKNIITSNLTKTIINSKKMIKNNTINIINTKRKKKIDKIIINNKIYNKIINSEKKNLNFLKEKNINVNLNESINKKIIIKNNYKKYNVKNILNYNNIKKYKKIINLDKKKFIVDKYSKWLNKYKLNKLNKLNLYIKEKKLYSNTEKWKSFSLKINPNNKNLKPSIKAVDESNHLNYMYNILLKISNKWFYYYAPITQIAKGIIKPSLSIVIQFNINRHGIIQNFHFINKGNTKIENKAIEHTINKQKLSSPPKYIFYKDLIMTFKIYPRKKISNGFLIISYIKINGKYKIINKY